MYLPRIYKLHIIKVNVNHKQKINFFHKTVARGLDILTKIDQHQIILEPISQAETMLNKEKPEICANFYDALHHFLRMVISPFDVFVSA